MRNVHNICWVSGGRRQPICKLWSNFVNAHYDMFFVPNTSQTLKCCIITVVIRTWFCCCFLSTHSIQPPGVTLDTLPNHLMPWPSWSKPYFLPTFETNLHETPIPLLFGWSTMTPHGQIPLTFIWYIIIKLFTHHRHLPLPPPRHRRHHHRHLHSKKKDWVSLIGQKNEINWIDLNCACNQKT